MGKVKTALRNVSYGAVIGSAMLIPGVSGGTTAIILGIYDSLVRAVSELFKNFKRHIWFLVQVAAGGILGVLLFSKTVLWLVETFYFPMMYFFIGAILGSIPLMVKKAKITMKNLYNVMFALLGILLALSTVFLPDMKQAEMSYRTGGILTLALCGLIISAALILPGISTSHILLVLGMYESVLEAIGSMNLLYIGIIGIGVLLGIFLCTKVLQKSMERFPSATFMMITGFVMASVYDIFPGVPTGTEMIISLIMFALAFSAVTVLSFRG